MVVRSKVRGASLDLEGLRFGTLRVPLPVTASSGVEVDLAKKLPARCVVDRVFVDITTGASSVTALFDLGTLSTASGGDADGFLVGANYGTAVPIQGSHATAGRTAGALLQVVSGSTANSITHQPAILDLSRNVSFTPRAALNNLNAEAVFVFYKL